MVYTVGVILGIILLIILLVTGSIWYKLSDDELILYATYWFPYKIKLYDIKEVKYTTDFFMGIRVCGLGNLKCCAGLFRNKTYGNYRLYTNNFHSEHIEIKLHDGDTVVVGLADRAKLTDLYNSLNNKIEY